MTLMSCKYILKKMKKMKFEQEEGKDVYDFLLLKFVGI